MRRKSPSTDTVFFWVYICQRSVQDQFCNNSVVVDCLGIAFVNEWMNRNEPESSDLQAESARPNRGAELEADCVGLQKLYCVWNSCSIHNPAEVEFEPDTNKKKWPTDLVLTKTSYSSFTASFIGQFREWTLFRKRGLFELVQCFYLWEIFLITNCLG